MLCSTKIKSYSFPFSLSFKAKPSGEVFSSGLFGKLATSSAGNWIILQYLYFILSNNGSATVYKSILNLWFSSFPFINSSTRTSTAPPWTAGIGSDSAPVIAIFNILSILIPFYF